MNHLWQRFLMASVLVVGLFIGVAATVFGYSNLASVDVHWSVLHLDRVPLWTVAVVPLALFVVAGTIYHWMNGLHHFTEHMRHRHRVHELEAEVASLRAHLDQVLEMPDHSTSRRPERKAGMASLPAADEPFVDASLKETEPKPAQVSALTEAPQVPAAHAVDWSGHTDAHADGAQKTRPTHRKRVTLEVGGEPRRPVRSESHVEGTIDHGKAAEPADTLEPEG